MVLGPIEDADEVAALEVGIHHAARAGRLPEATLVDRDHAVAVAQVGRHVPEHVHERDVVRQVDAAMGAVQPEAVAVEDERRLRAVVEPGGLVDGEGDVLAALRGDRDVVAASFAQGSARGTRSDARGDDAGVHVEARHGPGTARAAVERSGGGRRAGGAPEQPASGTRRSETTSVVRRRIPKILGMDPPEACAPPSRGSRHVRRDVARRYGWIRIALMNVLTGGAMGVGTSRHPRARVCGATQRPSRRITPGVVSNQRRNARWNAV